MTLQACPFAFDPLSTGTKRLLICIAAGGIILALNAIVQLIQVIMIAVGGPEIVSGEAFWPVSLVDGLLTLCYFFVLVTSVVLWFIWSYRTNTFARLLGVSGMDFSPGWTIGWFFIPIASLWMPYRVFCELWRVSEPDLTISEGERWRGLPAPSIIAWWWAATILSSFIDRLTLTQPSIEESSQPMTAALIWLFSSLVGILWHLAAWIMIRSIGTRQLSRAAALAERWDIERRSTQQQFGGPGDTRQGEPERPQWPPAPLPSPERRGDLPPRDEMAG